MGTEPCTFARCHRHAVHTLAGAYTLHGTGRDGARLTVGAVAIAFTAACMRAFVYTTIA